jgi:hypothetical protein
VSSEALAKEDWSFGGLRRTAGATGSCPWGSTDQDRSVLPGHILQFRFHTVLRDEPYHIFESLNSTWGKRCNFRGKLPGLFRKGSRLNF